MKKMITYEGQPCRKCGVPVVKRTPKRKAKGTAYHFAWFLQCPSCGTSYIVNDAKIVNTSQKKIW